MASSTSRVKGLPEEKSQATSLKQPGQCRRHPETKRVVLTPTPFAMSQYLISA